MKFDLNLRLTTLIANNIQVAAHFRWNYSELASKRRAGDFRLIVKLQGALLAIWCTMADTCAKRLSDQACLCVFTMWRNNNMTLRVLRCFCHGASSPGEARGSNFLICIYLELDRGQSTASARGLLNALTAQHTKYRRARVVSPTNNPGALTLNVPGARLYADDVTRSMRNAWCI
jgi:hypothetical protein